ncbi:hypothetical protein BD324DRAFT_648270 [Kockovaella imperatae]|uniref:Uncharacterized protein n=1 Tax=Kockovaella imperatae TaxID=4999 RepID=A0A1Y1UNQ8_9TREE|nr:hypothetical protein BD324DRAFT_648270 [Kockovaella imperatae]ORX39632.1 hypothetical protein BD324DRAFT_648270 [Kockovaella imperatae]
MSYTATSTPTTHAGLKPARFHLVPGTRRSSALPATTGTYHTTSTEEPGGTSSRIGSLSGVIWSLLSGGGRTEGTRATTGTGKPPSSKATVEFLGAGTVLADTKDESLCRPGSSTLVDTVEGGYDTKMAKEETNWNDEAGTRELDGEAEHATGSSTPGKPSLESEGISVRDFASAQPALSSKDLQQCREDLRQNCENDPSRPPPPDLPEGGTLLDKETKEANRRYWEARTGKVFGSSSEGESDEGIPAGGEGSLSSPGRPSNALEDSLNELDSTRNSMAVSAPITPSLQSVENDPGTRLLEEPDEESSDDEEMGLTMRNVGKHTRM